ncbi:amidase signature domain-containing protein [Xylariomycetidae sp. FL2044]|nr:amidase signature domain-containing protein [Xylariomycetidae sp. FL2044]
MSKKEITPEDLARTAGAIGYAVPEADAEAYRVLMERARQVYEAVEAMDDYLPIPSQTESPRTNIHHPEPFSAENPLNAWAYRCTATHQSPTSSLLQGKTLCLKDNITLSGVPCLLGTTSLRDWTPLTDATVVTRVLLASGTIAGKAVCENLSRGAVSCTAATGPVHNPWAAGYSAGGSSSGTGALVGAGAVDMGLGCDQGGSVRIPAALCGIYGMKATLGLVPYTGIASIDASVDFVGPMTRSARDCAVLLQVLAGADGLDDRQIAGTPFPADVPAYAEILEKTKAAEEGVRGLKIGILKEGVSSPVLDDGVERRFREAVAKFEALGAMVREVSVPMHDLARSIYSVMSKMGNHMGMLGRATGRRQVLLSDLYAKKDLPYTQDALERMSTFSREGLLAGELGWERYPLAYAKAVNLCRKMKDQYDEALQQVDVLVMPTTLRPTFPLPDRDAPVLAQMDAGKGMTENTAAFNATGHPALAMPIGFVPSKADPSVKVPASLQLVGRYWDESTLLKTAYAWECANDWKKL